MYVKIHHSSGKVVVAICDEELMGKKFSENKLMLNVSERFYNGEKKSREEIKQILKKAENINIVGNEIVTLALEMDILTKDSIVTIKGVPHAQILGL